MPKPNKSTPSLILASASPRRRSLMKEHGYRFKIIPSHIPENISLSLPPAVYVKTLARKKALHIAKKYPHHVILGADTVVYIKNKIINKPRHQKEAEQILKMLSGAWQRVYSGVAVIWNGGKEYVEGYAVSYVKFRTLSEKDIAFAAKKHLDKAGAYSVQQKNDPFVTFIKGDFDNVVGLPMKLVKKLLRRSAQRLLKTVGHNINFQI